jgi:hypothetical protein
MPNLFKLFYIIFIHQELWGYTIQEKLHLWLREQRMLNTTALESASSCTLYEL